MGVHGVSVALQLSSPSCVMRLYIDDVYVDEITT